MQITSKHLDQRFLMLKVSFMLLCFQLKKEDIPIV